MRNMQVVIPMSGFGERFKKAGYTVPKFLIETDGKPIIGHVVDLFVGVTRFIFICNEDHLSDKNFKLEQILMQLAPQGEIVPIAPHRKGPVYAVLHAKDSIDDSKPVLVNYCDFTCDWDFRDFCSSVAKTKCDGCIPAYRGFHPHMLGTTNYAFMREKDGLVLDIQEKKPFTDNRMNEYASSGTYYFSSGALLKDACKKVVDRDLNVNGEYYMSLCYKPLFEEEKKVTVYELQHFMQWGTPEDFKEYSHWSQVFRDLIDPKYKRSTELFDGALLLPMAGAGSRFVQEGYKTPKPLISVSGKPMVVQAAHDLPQMQKQVFVVRKDLPSLDEIKTGIAASFPQSHFVDLEALTEGQASTCLLGLVEGVDLSKPLMIGACDNGALYEAQKFSKLMKDAECDMIVWVARGYPGAALRPQMYGWVDAEGEVVKGVSVKIPLRDPTHDPIILGTFTFKRAGDFKRCAERLIERNGRINDEFYVDSCIEDALALGLKVKMLEVKQYLCWGSPNDLKTFNYWQECFSRWGSHPYTTDQDSRFT